MPLRVLTIPMVGVIRRCSRGGEGRRGKERQGEMRRVEEEVRSGEVERRGGEERYLLDQLHHRHCHREEREEEARLLQVEPRVAARSRGSGSASGW